MRRLFWTLVLLVSLAGTVLLVPRVVMIAQGAPTPSVTPSGEYGVAGVQIFALNDGAAITPTFYCNFAGITSFSGGRRDPIGTTGSMTFSGTVRCNGVVVQPDPQTGSLSYTVTGPNEFEFLEPGNEASGPVHGRVLNGGDVLILDGTKRNPIPAGGNGSFVDYATGVRP